MSKARRRRVSVGLFLLLTTVIRCTLLDITVIFPAMQIVARKSHVSSTFAIYIYIYIFSHVDYLKKHVIGLSADRRRRGRGRVQLHSLQGRRAYFMWAGDAADCRRVTGLFKPMLELRHVGPFTRRAVHRAQPRGDFPSVLFHPGVRILISALYFFLLFPTSIVCCCWSSAFI